MSTYTSGKDIDIDIELNYLRVLFLPLLTFYLAKAVDSRKNVYKITDELRSSRPDI